MSFKKASSWALSGLFSFFVFVVTSGCGTLSHAGQSFFSTESSPRPIQELDYDFKRQITRTFPNNSLELNVFIDDKFSGPERELIQKGLMEWERATNGTVRFLITKPGAWNSNNPPVFTPEADPTSGIIRCSSDIYIVRSFHTDKMVVDVEKAIKDETKKSITIAGYAHPACRVKYFFIVADRVDDQDRYVALTIHEMGHILGLRHVELEHMTAMYPGLPHDSSCVSLLDVAQFCNLWKCDVKKMKPCHI